MNDYLSQIEEQLVELAERGAHRRPRPRLDVLALAAAVAVVAAVAVAVSTIGGGAHQRRVASHAVSTPARHPGGAHQRAARTTTSSAVTYPPPAGGPVPPGFAPQSFTAIGELTWWLLGTVPCSSPPCTSIVRTTDGGRSFVAVPAPPTAKVSQVRFANPADGFAYGPELWATHDGGAQWRRVAIAGRVTDLAISGGEVYAIVALASDNAGLLVRSPIGGGNWTLLTAKTAVSGGLWAHGADVLAESGDQTELLVSRDQGLRFSRYPAPSQGLPCQFEMPEPPVIWAHCATGMLSGTWRSADGGQHFTQANGPTELPNSAAFGSASAMTAVVGYRRLYRTTDGGASWRPASGPVGITWWQYLGFTDPTHGVAIGYVGTAQPSNERLYYTTDGGASYHLVKIA